MSIFPPGNTATSLSSLASELALVKAYVDTLETRLPATGYADSATTVAAGQSNIFIRQNVARAEVGNATGTDAAVSVDSAGTVQAHIRDVGNGVDLLELGLIGASPSTTVARQPGRRQTFSFSVTAAANAAATTIATATTAAFVVESVIVSADAAQTGDFTSAVLALGNAGTENVVLDGTQLIAASFSAESEQVAAQGSWLMRVGDLLTIDPTGTGATALALTVIVTGYAVGAGGYLA